MLRSFLARLGGLCLLALLAAGCQRTLIFPSTPTSPAGSTSGAAERTATITQIKGTVETRSSANAAWKAAGLNQVLAEGSQVRTSADGSAVVTLTEGTHIYVGGNTQFTLTLLNKFLDSLLTTLDLQQGQLWVALNGGALDIQTPFGIASARNAYLSVELVPQSRTINVTCLQGVCGFGSILIPNGYKLINAADNQSPAKMQMADYGVWGVAVPEATQLAFLATEAVVQGSATIPAVLSPTSSPSPQPSNTPQPTPTTTPTPQPTATTAATETPAPAATSTGAAAATDTETSVPPTDTPLPPTDTPQPPTDTPVPSPTLPQFQPTVTPVPITPVPPAPIMGTHLVLPGETVFCIARGYGVLPAAIAQANGLSQELLIYSGQVLRIPEVQWVNIAPGPVCPPQFASIFPGLPVIPTATATPVASATPAGPPLTLSLTWHCVQNCNSKQGSYVVRVAAQAAGGIAPYTYTPGQTYDVTVAHCTTGQGTASVTSADGQTAKASWTFHDTACP
jgi:LysM repeat protein